MKLSEKSIKWLWHYITINYVNTIETAKKNKRLRSRNYFLPLVFMCIAFPIISYLSASKEPEYQTTHLLIFILGMTSGIIGIIQYSTWQYTKKQEKIFRKIIAHYLSITIFLPLFISLFSMFLSRMIKVNQLVFSSKYTIVWASLIATFFIACIQPYLALINRSKYEPIPSLSRERIWKTNFFLAGIIILSAGISYAYWGEFIPEWRAIRRTKKYHELFTPLIPLLSFSTLGFIFSRLLLSIRLLLNTDIKLPEYAKLAKNLNNKLQQTQKDNIY